MTSSEESNIQKKVDESWKSQVEKEKSAPSKGTPPPREAGTPSPQRPQESASSQGFGAFLSSLSMQAMIALGEIPHPMTNAPEEDLEQARYVIDVLGMFQDKTRGNLTPQEEQLLKGLLYELRMKYVAKTQQIARAAQQGKPPQ